MISPRSFAKAFVSIMRLSFSLVILAAASLETGCVRRSVFYSQVTFEYVAPAGTDAKAAILALLPKGDSSITLTQRKNSALYEIGVYDPVPQKAAERANALAISIRDALNNEASGKRRITIWERAVPGLYPQR